MKNKLKEIFKKYFISRRPPKFNCELGAFFLDDDGIQICNGDVSIKTDETIDIEKLQQENKQLKDNWNKLKKELWHLRTLTFTKENGNEWNNCLSFNEDVLPIIKKMQELEKGDSNE